MWPQSIIWNDKEIVYVPGPEKDQEQQMFQKCSVYYISFMYSFIYLFVCCIHDKYGLFWFMLFIYTEKLQNLEMILGMILGSDNITII